LETILFEPWPWYVSGVLFGLIVPALLIAGGKQFGISSGLRDICSFIPQTKFKYFNYDLAPNKWNLYFTAGILIGGFVAVQFLNGNGNVDISESTIADLKEFGITDFTGLMPTELFNWDNLFTLQGIILMVVGGFSIGFGVRYANGCTSGHAIMGLSQLSPASLIAVIGFFTGGLIMTYLIYPLIF
jgi:uncharacterized membrane protein YedE/YeeE